MNYGKLVFTLAGAMALPCIAFGQSTEVQIYGTLMPLVDNIKTSGATAKGLSPATGGATSPTTTASAGATISTPVLEEIYSTHGTVATTGQGGSVNIVEIDGGLIIPPGFYVASYTSAATTAAFIFSLKWTEVPI